MSKGLPACAKTPAVTSEIHDNTAGRGAQLGPVKRQLGLAEGGDGLPDLGVFSALNAELTARALEIGLCGRDSALRGLECRTSVVPPRARHHATLLENKRTRCLGLDILEIGARGSEVRDRDLDRGRSGSDALSGEVERRARSVHLELKGPRIDSRQQVAALDDLPVAYGHRGDLAGDFGNDVDNHRFDADVRGVRRYPVRHEIPGEDQGCQYRRNRHSSFHGPSYPASPVESSRPLETFSARKRTLEFECSLIAASPTRALILCLTGVMVLSRVGAAGRATP